MESRRNVRTFKAERQIRGEKTERIRSLGHDKLSTYGLLADCPRTEIRHWIYQLIGQGVLCQEGDEYPVLRLNNGSWEVMRKEREVQLRRSARRRKGEQAARSKADTASWEGVERDLFEKLRRLRRELAEERQVPPYVIFSDATIRELARQRPSTLGGMRAIYGIGDAKLLDLGQRFLQVILDHCGSTGVAVDVIPPSRGFPAKTPEIAAPRLAAKPGSRPAQAFDLFRAGAAIEDVMHQTNRARTTVTEYLCDFIRRERPPSLSAWMAPEVYERVAASVRRLGADRLKPIFLDLGETVPYEQIRLVVTHLNSQAAAET